MPELPTRWSHDGTCYAPGPRGLECSGRAGHTGLHGFGDERWTDLQAEQHRQEAEGQDDPQEAASGPLGVFRGAVHTQGRDTFQGVVTLLDEWVHVELIGTVRDGVSAVMLPHAMVRAIDVAREQTERA